MMTPPLPPQALNEAYALLAMAADPKGTTARLNAIKDAQAEVDKSLKDANEARAAAEA